MHMFGCCRLSAGCLGLLHMASLAVQAELIPVVVVELPERASPKVQTLHKLTLVSHLLIFHWPKQGTWLNPDPGGREIESIP